MKTQRETPISPYAYRTAGVVLASLGCFRLGIAYTPLTNLPSDLPDGLRIIVSLLPQGTDNWEPIWLLGFAWLILGVLLLLSLGFPRLHTPTYLAAIFGSFWWAGAYVVASPSTSRAWITASSYVLLIGYLTLVWLMTKPTLLTMPLKRAGDDE